MKHAIKLFRNNCSCASTNFRLFSNCLKHSMKLSIDKVFPWVTSSSVNENYNFCFVYIIFQTIHTSNHKRYLDYDKYLVWNWTIKQRSPAYKRHGIFSLFKVTEAELPSAILWWSLIKCLNKLWLRTLTGLTPGVKNCHFVIHLHTKSVIIINRF